MVSLQAPRVDKSVIWSMGAETIKALFPIYRLALQAVLQASNIQKEWIILFHVRGSESEPFTMARLQRLLPYTAQQTRSGGLAVLVERGLLQMVDEDHYRLTTQGYRATDRILRMVQRELGKAELLPHNEAKALANVLWRLVQAVYQAPEPIDRLGFNTSRWTDMGVHMPVVTRIDQYLTDLGRFRDDCHFAAWRHYHIPGSHWETLTSVWRGEAVTATDLVSHLCYRGYTAEHYANALKKLEEFGWIEASEKQGTYRVTQQGCIVRQEAETRTNALFFAPWMVLSTTEIEHLYDLLAGLLDRLKLKQPA